MVRLQTYFVLAACCATAAIAHADPRPRHVAVLEFDGSHELAQAGRAAVLSMLGQLATIVPAKQWTDALAHAPGHGPERWRWASSQADIDAVVEGWVQLQGRHHRLTIAVRDAATGVEMRSLSVAIDVHGPAAGEVLKLATSLREIIDQIEQPAPAVEAPTPLASDRERAGPEAGSLGATTRRRVVASDEWVEPPEVERAAAVPRDASPTPRFALGGGPFVATRTMSPAGELPKDPGHTIYGVAVEASVFPLSRSRTLSGPGIALELGKSLVSSTAGGYSLSQLAWELGVHYRLSLASITIDLDLDGGNAASTLVDRPESLAIPSTSFSYVGGGMHVDLEVIDGLTLGIGARYLYLLGIGEIGEQDWYGAGLATGVALDADGALDISRLLYVRAGLAYRRVEVRFDGSGALTKLTGGVTVVDRAISGALDLGVRF